MLRLLLMNGLMNGLLGGMLHPALTTPAFRFISLLFALMLCSLFLNNPARAADTATALAVAADKPLVRLHTNRGDIVIELWPEKSPITVDNFLKYVDAGFYSGTIFHRVLGGTLIQGGGYNKYMQLKQTREPIRNESRNRLRHERGTIAMARLLKPNTATAQFFINTRLNSQLNYRAGQSGYAIFGRVIEGMDIVDAIAKQPTGTLGAFSDVPLNLIIIDSATRVTATTNTPAAGAPATTTQDTKKP
jgi:cyclophilin family peptidyl-prolyl cis-trans isomerase